MGTVFQFKQFSVQHHNSAMKVGTDGVLLGAWVGLEGVKSVLDVGTGTGLIALMVAQRKPDTKITAVELEAGAVEDAKVNFLESPWSTNIKLVHQDIKEFEEEGFDLVVSNPPFFVNSFKSVTSERSNARHDETLSFYQLLEFVVKSKSKKLAVIYPYDRLNDLKKIVYDFGWKISRICYVHPTLEKGCSRIMIEIGPWETSIAEENLVVDANGRHAYSKEYINLTKEFYLKM